MLNVLRIIRREVGVGRIRSSFLKERNVEAEKITVFSSQCNRERKAELGDDKRWPKMKGGSSDRNRVPGNCISHSGLRDRATLDFCSIFSAQ